MMVVVPIPITVACQIMDSLVARVVPAIVIMERSLVEEAVLWEHREILRVMGRGARHATAAASATQVHRIVAVVVLPPLRLSQVAVFHMLVRLARPAIAVVPATLEPTVVQEVVLRLLQAILVQLFAAAVPGVAITVETSMSARTYVVIIMSMAARAYREARMIYPTVSLTSLQT